MALPVLNDLRAYLRIDDDNTYEDALLTALLLRARAILQGLIAVPIVSREMTYVDRSEQGVQFGEPTMLMFPVRPIGSEVAITDGDGVEVETTDYTVDTQSGFVYATRGISFPNGPYTLVADVGIDLMEDYATGIEPMLAQAIIDIASDLYLRRTPGAVTETAAKSSVTWDCSKEVLGRVRTVVSVLKLPVVAA